MGWQYDIVTYDWRDLNYLMVLHFIRSINNYRRKVDKQGVDASEKYLKKIVYCVFN